MSFFDVEALRYDAWYETPMGRFVDETETRLAFRLFNPEPGMKVLDAGCGTGNFSLKLARRGCLVTGVDLSGNMLQKAREKTKAVDLAVEYVKGDLTRLPFEDESFDAVFSMAAFEFIEPMEPAFSELMRVVRKGGRVLVGTINKESAWGRLYETEEVRQTTVFRHAVFKTMAEFEALDPSRLAGKGQCLFPGPLSSDSEFSMERERALAGTTEGGYFCFLWVK